MYIHAMYMNIHLHIHPPAERLLQHTYIQQVQLYIQANCIVTSASQTTYGYFTESIVDSYFSQTIILFSYFNQYSPGQLYYQYSRSRSIVIDTVSQGQFYNQYSNSIVQSIQ